ncbi:MAG: zf-TFIIB domain-containing protein [Actinomycetes bacterium]
MQLTCPKCQGPMRQYERSGITVDQCHDCRGIFLDRGELERLTDAENAWFAGPGGSGPGGSQSRGKSYDRDRDDDRDHRDRDRHRDYDDDRSRGYGQHGDYRHKSRKKSFLDELFG